MRTTAFVNLDLSSAPTGPAWSGFGSTGVAWTNPANAVSTIAPGASALFAGTPAALVTKPLLVRGFSALEPLIDPTGHIYALQVQLTARKNASTPAMRLDSYTPVQINPITGAPSWTGTTTSPALALTATFANYNLGALASGDCLGFQAAGYGPPSAAYVTPEMLRAFGLVLMFATPTAPGVEVDVYNVRVRALYNSSGGSVQYVF